MKKLILSMLLGAMLSLSAAVPPPPPFDAPKHVIGKYILEMVWNATSHEEVYRKMKPYMVKDMRDKESLIDTANSLIRSFERNQREMKENLRFTHEWKNKEPKAILKVSKPKRAWAKKTGWYQYPHSTMGGTILFWKEDGVWRISSI